MRVIFGIPHSPTSRRETDGNMNSELSTSRWRTVYMSGGSEIRVVPKKVILSTVK